MKLSKSLASSLKGVFTGFNQDVRKSSPEKVSPVKVQHQRFVNEDDESREEEQRVDSH
jgi:hypothetical protein